MEVTLSLATTDDLPVLSEINRLAYTPETMAQIAFVNWPDEQNMRIFFTARVKERLVHPNTQVFKAVDTATGEITGFACWTLEEGDEEKPGFGEPVQQAPNPTSADIQQVPGFLNMEFVMTSGAEIGSLKNLMKGSKHYYLSTFVVAPQYQRRGIGSQLLRHCLSIADKNGLPTWLISFPGSHDLYLRLGFEDVEHCDADLNAWDNFKFRGFGIYRLYAMKRQPKTNIIDAA